MKIQLRFCAEAYSRMAQVQQYVSFLYSYVDIGIFGVSGLTYLCYQVP